MPVTKKSLFEEIKQFNRDKKKYALILLIVGFAGLLLPVIPGLMLIVLGIMLLHPKLGQALSEKIKDWVKFLFR
ncbi:MAG TPA: hypothetical protein ENN22_08385 [bacterium]|nr:hypothetical protein [bacterium]